MKLVSWNVNGLRACLQKGFLDQFNAFDADFYCLQETKLSEGQLELELPGYEQYWCYAEKKGYSGTAIFTKHTPLSVHYGLDVPELDNEGRMITLEYPEFFLVTCYTPNAQRELARISHRMSWDDAFRAYLQKLDGQKPVIVCGDLNVAHREIDLKNPKSNRGSAGFSDEERQSFQKTLDLGFTDTFRHLHPDATGCYSWWSYMFKAREKNAGWRIDYFLVSDRVRQDVYRAEIHSDILGSDHCPVSIQMDLACNGGIWSPTSLGKAKLQAPESDSDHEPKASAVKAKALVPFAAIAVLILCICLLWQPLSADGHPTDPALPLSDLVTVRVIDEDFSWLSAYESSSSVTAVVYEYMYVLYTDTESFHIDKIPASQVEDSNTVICLELTDAALEAGVQPGNISVTMQPLTQYNTYDYYNNLYFDETSGISTPLTVQVTPHDVLFQDQQIIPYYTNSTDRKLLGWLVLGEVTRSAEFEIHINLDGDSYHQMLSFNVPVPSIVSPFILKPCFLPMEPVDVFAPGAETPSYEMVAAGDSLFYVQPHDGPDISTASYWFVAAASDEAMELLDLSDCDLTATGVIVMDDFIDSTIPATPSQGLPDTGSPIIVRPYYTNSSFTKICGWLIYGFNPCDYLQIRFQCPAADYSYNSGMVAVEYFIHAEQAEQMTTQQLVTEIFENFYMCKIIESLIYAEETELTFTALMNDVPLLAELYTRADAIDTLMNFRVPENSAYPYTHIHLLNFPEFTNRMTLEQQVRRYVYEFPGNNTSIDWKLNWDADLTAMTKGELIDFVAQYSSNWYGLMSQSNDFKEMAYYILRNGSNVLLELEKQPYALKALKDRLLVISSLPSADISAIPVLIELWPYIQLQYAQDPGEFDSLSTEQLVDTILSNEILCDQIMNQSDPFSFAVVKALLDRDDAAQHLMLAEPDPISVCQGAVHRLLSTEQFMNKMDPRQMALYLSRTYVSCPVPNTYFVDHGTDIILASTEDLLTYLQADMELYQLLAVCPTEEVRQQMCMILIKRNGLLFELSLRPDAQQLLEEYSKTDVLSPLPMLLDLWPFIQSLRVPVPE